MKKIVFIVQDSAIGGGTSSLSSLYNHIKDEYDVDVFQLTDSGDAILSYSHLIKKANNFCRYYYGFLSQYRGMVKILVFFIKLLSRIFPSIINVSVRRFEREYRNAQCVIAYGEGAAAHFTSRLRSIKKIVWIHYDITYYPSSEADLQLYSKFDKIVCVADKIARGMGEMYPLLKDKILGIHNLIDVKRVVKLSKELIHSADECFFNTPFTIISIGRVCTVKRFDHIPQIASKLKDKQIRFRWIIIGPENDLAELNRIQNLILLYNVSDCVVLMGPKHNPYPYLARADLFVSTSSTEACPMVFIESKILNIPIISSDMFTAEEFVTNGKDGFVVPVKKIAEIIELLIVNPELYQSLTHNSDNFVYNDEALEKFRTII